MHEAVADQAGDDAEPDLSVVFPAYNERDRLPGTVRETTRYLQERGLRFEIIVADDGSTDGTAAVVAAMADEVGDIDVLRVEENRGKGDAVRRGVLAARGRLILVADADGATPIAELERLEAALANGAEVAVGSRALSGPGIARRTRLHRRVMGRTFAWVVDRLVVSGIEDTQCGFKLFTRAAGHRLFRRSRIDGFGFDVEILALARASGVPVTEVAVSWYDIPRSRVSLVSDSAAMLAEVLSVRRRLREAPDS